MTTVQKKIRIDAPADEVWATVSDFGRIHEYTAAIKSTDADGSRVGDERRLTLQDGAQVTERLEMLDEEKKALHYTITASPLPIKDYDATMSVREVDGGGCEVEWACEVEPDGAPEGEVKKLFGDLYEMGLRGLDEMHAA